MSNGPSRKTRLSLAAVIAILAVLATLAFLPVESQAADKPDAAWSYYAKPSDGPYEVIPWTYFHRFHLDEGQVLQADLGQCGANVYGPEFTPLWDSVAPGMNQSQIEANKREFTMGPCDGGTIFPKQAQPLPQLLMLPARGIEAANAADAAYVRADGDAVWAMHSYKASKSEDVDLVLRLNLTKDANPPRTNSTFVELHLASPVVSVLEPVPAWKALSGPSWATTLGAVAFIATLAARRRA
jgi:hypothetical protein